MSYKMNIIFAIKRLSMIKTNLKYIISNKQNLGCCKEHQKELDKQ